MKSVQSWSLLMAGMIGMLAAPLRAEDAPMFTNGAVSEVSCDPLQQESAAVVIALAGVFLKPLVTRGMELGSEYAKAMAESYAASTSMIANGNIMSVQLAKVNTRPPGTPKSLAYYGHCIDVGVGPLAATGKYYENEKAIKFESELVAVDGTAASDDVLVAFRAHRLVFANAQSKGSGAKDLVITYTVTFPTIVDKNGAPTSVTVVLPTLQGVRAGDKLVFPGNRLQTPAFKLPVDMETLHKAIQSPGQSVAFNASVKITVAETDKGKGALLYQKLAAALDDAKGDAAKAAVDALDKKK